jgi:transposase
MKKTVFPGWLRVNTAGIIGAGGTFERREELLERLRQGPGEPARRAVMPGSNAPAPNRWTLHTIRASVDWFQGYTLSGIWYWLKRHGIRLRSARVQQWSPDEEYLPKRDHLLEWLQTSARHPREMGLLFLDEMGYYRWPIETQVWWATAPVEPAMAIRGGGNNTQWRIVGALNVLTGQVNYLDNYIVGRKQLIEMYRQIANIYSHARRIWVVQDNWSIHQHPDVLESLQSWPQIEPVWLPTYSPWLNPIEKLWRWLRQDVLKMHRWVADHKKLRSQVRAFLDQFAQGSPELLCYVGLLGEGMLAQALVCQ